jgi:hypothetical protein
MDKEWEEGFKAAYDKSLAEGDGWNFPNPPENKRGLFLRGWAEGVITGASDVRKRNKDTRTTNPFL